MEKIKSSIAGIGIGFILILAGLGLLFFNESNNVKNLKTVAEIREVAYDISPTYNASNDGELVALAGDVTVNADVTDTVFGITETAVRLVRKVEMYQWVEESHTDDDDHTTYTYKKEWRTTLIDSSDFNESGTHQNPTSMPYENESVTSTDVTIGDFSLSDYQKGMFSATETVSNFDGATLPNEYIASGSYIASADLATPEVGTVRISFTYAAPEKGTILAVQTSDKTLVDYTSEVGKTVNRVAEGEFTATEMIDQLEDANNMLKWILRIGGAIAVIVGIGLMLNPLAALTDFIPIVGDLVGAAVWLFAFLVGSAISLVAIAIAWIVFRPLLGIGLLVLVAVLLFFARSYAKNKQALNG